MSRIEWTEKTWNPLAGCSPVSEGCAHCYAIRQAARLQAMGHAKYAGTTRRTGGRRVWTGMVNLDEDALKIPLRTQSPTTWFVNSMSDLFHPDVPFWFVDKVFAVTQMCHQLPRPQTGDAPDHLFQFLTKRIDLATAYLNAPDCWERVQRSAFAMIDGGDVPHRVRAVHASTAWPPPNVWLGTSVEDQATADERIPHLLSCPAAVRFLSCEPLLGRVALPEPTRYTPDADLYGEGLFTIFGLHWVIIGGESGPGARPCDVDWIRSIVTQCRSAAIPCFVKQLGARPFDPSWHGDGTPQGSRMMLTNPKGGDPAEWPADLRVRQMPGASAMGEVRGRKKVRRREEASRGSELNREP